VFVTAVESATVNADDGITVGLDDRVTVPDETATVFVTAVESATVNADDGITVGLDDKITVGFEESVTAAAPPNVERATTSPDIDDVTALGVLDATVTKAVFAPLMIETAPDETDVIVGLDDKMTVGLLESVTVPDETATMLLPVTETEKLLNEEIATASAGDAELTCAVTTPTVFAPLAMAIVPDETEVIVGFDESVTVNADDGITVGLDESVTAFCGESVTTSADIVDVAALDATVTYAVLAPLMMETAPDETEVIVGFDERITVGFDESVTVPDDIAVMLVTAVESATVIADDGVTVPEETATTLLPVVVTEKLLNEEIATARAGDAELT
jgi:hypothetical protein